MEISSKLKIKRTENLAEQMQRVKGMYRRANKDWVVPVSVQRAMQIQMPMLRRYKIGDYRHTLEEAQAEEEIGIWLSNMHRMLHGLPLLKEAAWQSPWLDGRRKVKLSASLK